MTSYRGEKAWREQMPPLGLDDVHVWVLPRRENDPELLAEPEEHPHWLALLSAQERAHLERFRFPYLAWDYAAHHARIRILLAGYLKQMPRSIAFRLSRYGKPELDGENPGGITFNLSHAGGLGVLAVARHRHVGIDVEDLTGTKDCLSTARQFFSRDEVAALESCATAGARELEVAFLRCWTRKEAFLKAVGGGLTLPLAGFTVSLGADAHLLRCDWQPDAPEHWSLHSLSPEAGCVGALAVERSQASSEREIVSHFVWQGVPGA